ANMVKRIRLLKDDHFVKAQQHLCAMHTLQLSVKQELKQIKHIHQYLKNIQTFFCLPKQSHQLREMQISNTLTEPQSIDNNDKIANSLKILTNCKTH
ncbi:1148_t:CDS:1, partial [Cetraspora pellucida]